MTGSPTNPRSAAKEKRPVVPQSDPPASVEELRSLMMAIARREANIVLGPKARKALGKILDLLGDPSLLSITVLAERLDINASTITRLARNLGYDGFGSFQRVLLSASMAPPGSFYSHQAEIALGAKGAPSLGQAARLCHENQANIDRFVENFDAKNFDETVKLITDAPRVALHGIRQFHSLVSFLAYGLKMIRSDVSILDSNSLGVAEDIAAMSKGDVLITASCAPYSNIVAETARAAYEKGLSTISLTDNPSSPLVDYSKVALFVPHETSFISNSMATFIVAAECLINGCATVLSDNAKTALAERDLLIKRLSIEQ